MPDLVVQLGAIHPEESHTVGQKAANLARLLAAGFPVPPGFCVTTVAFEQAMEPFADCILDILAGEDRADPHSAARAAAAIDALLADVRLPDELTCAVESAVAETGDRLLAVRSSSTAEDLSGASFAGQYETILGVRGMERVSAAILSCWRSLYSANAIAERARRNLTAREAMGVLIQPLIEAECAGVCFSVDPVQLRRDLVVISAAWGTGAGVADGSVSSDTIWLRRSSWEAERLRIVQKDEQLTAAEFGLQRREVPRERRRSACLPDTWALRIASLAVLAEHVFDGPQDVEWAIAGQQYWVLQSRPLTGLPEEMRTLDPFPPSWETETDQQRRWTLWGVDRMRVPAPLEQDYRDLQVPLSWDDASRILGEEHFRDVRIINGRRYLAKRTGVLQAGDMRVRAQANEQMHERLLQDHGLTGWDIWGPEIIARTRQLHAFDLASATDEDLASYLEDAMGAYRRHWMLHTPLMFPNPRTYCRAYAALTGSPPEDFSEAAWALAEGDPTLTSEMVDELHALGVQTRSMPAAAELIRARPENARNRLADLPEAAGFLRALDAFLDRFGERNGTGRGSIGTPMTPTWGENIATVLALIETYLDPDTEAPAILRARAQAKRDAEVERLCATCPDPAMVVEFRRQLALARRMAEIEETHNHYIDQLSDGQLRLATIESGRRLERARAIDAPEDVWWLRSNEILNLLRARSRASQRELICDRRAEHLRWEQLTPPPVLGAPEQDLPPRPPYKDEVDEEPAGDDSAVRGQGGSRGRGSGPARIIAMGETEPGLRPGDVLVAVNAGPAWTAYFPVLAGVVLDEGSFAEHSTATAREYGVPVVFATRNGSKRIPDGAWVTVDGTTGVVEVAGHTI